MKQILSLTLLSIMMSCSSGSKKEDVKTVAEKTEEVAVEQEKTATVVEENEIKTKGMTMKQKEEIKTALATLSANKNPDSFVIVTEESVKQFVQFLPSGSGFLFDFPSEQLKADQIESAKKVLAPYNITLNDTYGGFSGMVSNSDTVVEITEKVITEVFGVSGEIDIKIEEN